MAAAWPCRASPPASVPESNRLSALEENCRTTRARFSLAAPPRPPPKPPPPKSPRPAAASGAAGAPGVRVMSRASVFRYKHKELDPQQVGRELKVDAVLTGSIAQHGDELVLSTELVKVDDGSHPWGEEYQRRKADLLTLQQEMAAEVSQRLQPNLTGEQRQRLTKLPTQSPEAYQLYVKGHYFLDRWSTESRKKAMTS